ncbi:MAG: maleylpyruvate isomerase N-terminal domain-containing protein [Vicinamibacteria bacterium]|nr:maleylpyruvate isomerase N-terminal domain-containing protein [Vicinamibacteria bacterium]MBP9945442.1 maleylpyruvate isomerase N-terminal domain-containing protein [Vicinamibacteria bacterium]
MSSSEGLTDLSPVDTSPLFRPLLAELTGLLRALNRADWDRPTLAGKWKVRDVAAHLLDGDLRRIAAGRDAHALPIDFPIQSDQDLARFVNGLNQQGVTYGARLSPRLLVDLLEVAGHWTADQMESLPMNAPALWAVSWAGERESLNWMDVGREYTEKWHHQMQIRDAVGEPRLLAPRFMEPLLEVSVRVLKVAYAKLEAPPGTAVILDVVGPTSAAYSVVREEGGWSVRRGRAPAPAAGVTVATDDAWRLFYNAVQSPGLMERTEVTGDRVLAEPMLTARSVVL